VKKAAALFFTVVVLCGSLSAFDIMSYPPSVEGGNIIVEAGAGISASTYSNWTGVIPPLFVDVDYLLPKIPLSVGLGVSYSSYHWEYGSKKDAAIFETLLPIMLRAMWHWGFNTSRLDFYTGFTAGYQLAFLGGEDYKDLKDAGWDSFIKSNAGFYYSFGLGLRYYFGEAKKFGLKLEAGYPMTKLGLSVKL
jgi:hypothetical protein